MNTAIFSDINWLAVLSGALAFFFLGALWYSKLLFVKPWLAYLKIDPNNPDAKKGVAVIMLGSFVVIFIVCAIIAVLRAKLDIGGSMSGLKLGLTTGLLGVAAVSINYLYEQKPLGLYFINGGYFLVGNIIAALIICNWV